MHHLSEGLLINGLLNEQLISLNYKDKKLLYKAFKKIMRFLSSVNISKKEFDDIILDIVCDALDFKYDHS